MNKLIKNIEHGTVLSLAGQVDYRPGQIVSKTLAQNNRHSLTLFAFEKDEEISTHASGGDVLVFVLDGIGKITIDGKSIFSKTAKRLSCPRGFLTRCTCRNALKCCLTFHLRKRSRLLT